MKAIFWEQQYDFNLPKGAIVRCEGCNKIVTNAYLIGPETVEEGLELRVKFKPPFKLTGICYHPDNIVMCKKCLTERFSFKERKLGRPFTIKLISIKFRRSGRAIVHSLEWANRCCRGRCILSFK